MSSCHLMQFVSVKDVDAFNNFFFENSSDSEEGVEWNIDEWNAEWNLNEVDYKPIVKKEFHDWIHSSIVALSPIGDFLCVANKDKAIFFTVRKSGAVADDELDVCFKGSLSEETKEVITSVLCLPLVSLKKTSYGSKDWTCILVGFSTGYIRMYSESGGLLISQLLHESPILEMHCRTSDTKFNIVYNGSAEHHDELTILYPDSLISMDGFSLFQTLRACRNQLAVATAQGSKAIDPPPLTYKKWFFCGQEKITSHLSVGIITPNHFNQMHAASVNNGFNADVKSATSAMHQFVTGGLNPFIGFYCATEGSSQPFLSHVAIAVASKLKSAFLNAASGWLTWGQKPSHDDQKTIKYKPKIEVGTGLDILCGVPDVLRSATCLVIAPGANWIAATCDSFGRVILLDLLKARAIRMWKGYRDAQIGFIQSTDDDDISKCSDGLATRRMALFLVIYASRRGIVEVWSCINGPRVSAFNVGKDAKLIYPGFGLFGLPLDQQTERLKTRIIQCCLLENNGSIKKLSVPFHLALSNSKSNKARDIHLLKSINKLLQNETKVDANEVILLITSMKLASLQLQATKKLLHTKFVSCQVFRQCLNEIINHLQCEDKTSKDIKELLTFAKSRLSLLDIFVAVEKLNKFSNKFESIPLKEISRENLSKELNVTLEESDRILKFLVDFCTNTPVETSMDYKSITAADFLGCFSSDEQSCCSLSTNVESMKLLGTYMFHSSLFSGILPSDILDCIQSNMVVSNKDILNLIFTCWMKNEANLTNNFLESVKSLKRYVELLSVEKDNDWRTWIQLKICYPSYNILSAYILTLICRSVEMSWRSNKASSVNDNKDSPPSYDEVVERVKLPSNTGWETLWPELESWNIVVRQYEDCIIINTAIGMTNREKCHQETNTLVSIDDLLTNGPGYIPELISRCICEMQLDPYECLNIVKFEEVDNKQYGSFLKYLHCVVLPSFPLILSNNSVHAHCFWYELLLWSKDPEIIKHVERAITHIRLVNDDLLLQGLSLMGWRTFISKTFFALAKLIDKVGKAPKDRLLRKETLMSDQAVPTFCHLCSQFLQLMVDSNSDNIQSSVFDQTCAQGDAWFDVQGKEAITAIAREQPKANQILLHLNIYLSFIMDGVMAFSLRGINPLTKLFNAMDRVHLLADLSTSQSLIVRHDALDPDINNHRKQFLFKVLRGAIKKLLLAPFDPHLKEKTKDWVDTCVHMAAEFNVDYNLIRIHYVCELVKHGFDEMAFDDMKSTGNDKQLASQLLIIIGQRLNHILFVASPEDGARLTAQMPITLSSWIKAQDSQNLDVADVSVESTFLLAKELPCMLSEDHELYDLSEFLVEALSVVINS